MNWNDLILIFYFYEKLYNKIKNAMILIKKSNLLNKMINVAIRINNY